MPHRSTLAHACGAFPLLSRIEWTWLQHQVPPILLLLRSILRRPKLADLTRSLVLQGNTFHRPPFRGRYPPKIAVEEAQLEDAVHFIKATGLPFADAWVRELRLGTMDALVSLLLCRLPNIRNLYLSPNFTKESRVLGMMLKAALFEHHALLPRFKNLRDVSFSATLDRFLHRSARNTGDGLVAVLLTRGQYLSVSLETLSSFAWPVSCAPNPVGMEWLNLRHMREAHLGWLLAATPRLKTLHWRWFYDPNVVDGQNNPPYICLDQISAALSHVCSSLANLSITAGCGYEFGAVELPALETRGPYPPWLISAGWRACKSRWCFY